MAYKMKGSPFQRNFGIGSPAKDTKVAKEGSELSKFDAAHNARHESGEWTKDHIVDNDVRARLREEKAKAEADDSGEE